MYTPTRVQDNYSSSYSYDLAGNLLTLTRNGFLGMDANNEPTYGLIDQLIYDYDDDLFLKSVENDINVASEDFGFKGEIGGYAYDDRGNMITSTLNGLTIDYNHINLPGGLSSDFGSQTTHYSLGGSKIMTVNQYADPPTGFPEDVTRVYFMGMELEYEGVGNFSSNFTPKAYHFGDGRLLFDGNDTRNQYHLHDHLGNVVVVFEDKNKDGFIEETDNPNTNEVPHRYHYYSFGMLWDLPDPLTPLYSDDNRYLYNGKEFERVANLLDYGWRWYDPVVGRWNGVDPLAEKMPAWSPYNYVFNNPMMMVDPDGRFPVPSPYGLYNRVNAWFFGKNMNALDQGSRLVNAYETASGENASAGIKFSAYFNGVLNEYGAYTSQNDAVVLMTGEHFDGSEATGFDKVMAGVFLALPVSGSGVSSALSSFLRKGDGLADGLKVLGDNSKSLRLHSEGSASTKFHELVRQSGGDISDVKIRESGARTFKGSDGRTITHRQADEGPTISTKMDDGRNLKIRFSNE